MNANNDNNVDILDILTEQGKEISVNVEIDDSERAKKLLETMYSRDSGEYGVIVNNWGFYDSAKVNKLRMRAIRDENERHQQAMATILGKTDIDYLNEDEQERNKTASIVSD